MRLIDADVLKKYIKNYNIGCGCNEDYQELFLKAIDEQLTITQEDAISKKTIIEFLECNLDVCNKLLNDKNYVGRDQLFNFVIDVIKEEISFVKELPQVTPKSKTGKWIRDNIYHGRNVYPNWKCSECGKNAPVDEYPFYKLTNYCPNCGAKMEEIK